MTNLNEFANWQAEKPARRNVKIEIEPNFHEGTPKVSCWVFDYDLMEGALVKSVAEIDLEKTKRDNELEKLAELKAKYEKVA
jgi:hypothetical protein